MHMPNGQSDKKKLLNPDYVDKQWSDDGSNDINLAELKAYFGILIILGINPVRQYKSAFSKDPYLGNEGIRKVMTLKWFEKMSQFMHVSNWELEIRNKNDPGYDPSVQGSACNKGNGWTIP